MKKNKLVISIILVAGLAACNKDDVIIGGGDVDVPTPEVPTVPDPSEPIDGMFGGPSYFYRSTTRYTFVGRPVFLTPLIKGSDYQWSVDGVKVDCDESTFKFTPESPGEYIIGLRIGEDVSGEIKVVCVNPTERDSYRSGTSKIVNVYEYVPAPGQFVNDTTGDMTPDEAAKWAAERIASGEFVSLGGFGGYIIVGFGHSIGDFVIKGNPFSNAGGASNEPGIIYVMQDVNENGLPDDEWYELKGSETFDSSTIQNYSVTYYRPSESQSSVKWIDCFGAEGQINYMSSFHKQDTYYPLWISEDSYTLRGTKVQIRSEINESGQWVNHPLKSGYADNLGDNDNVFYISDAMFADLSMVNLMYVDFIKIQTGTQGNCGILGELSTEVVSIYEK